MSPEMLKPRGQTGLEAKKFGLGLGLELLASASAFASKLSGLGLEVLASASRHSGHYRTSSQLPENSPNNFCATSTPTLSTTLSELAKLYCDFSVLQPLFDRLFCIPASSAPVMRIFSQSGLIMISRRARMSNAVLESLVFLKCNADI